MSTSLISGSPRRDTCTQLPPLSSSESSSTRAVLRLALAYTPITELRSLGSVGVMWLRARSVLGTCSTMLWTLRPATSSMPLLVGHGLAGSGHGTLCAALNGRSPSRSKTEPRSTKNGSSRWPAKTLPPLGRSVIAALARSSEKGGERGPILTGGTSASLLSTWASPSSSTRVTVYVWGRFQLAYVPFWKLIGPVLYRNVFGFTTFVLKRNWYVISSLVPLPL